MSNPDDKDSGTPKPPSKFTLKKPAIKKPTLAKPSIPLKKPILKKPGLPQVKPAVEPATPSAPKPVIKKPDSNAGSPESGISNALKPKVPSIPGQKPSLPPKPTEVKTLPPKPEIIDTSSEKVDSTETAKPSIPNIPAKKSVLKMPSGPSGIKPMAKKSVQGIGPIKPLGKPTLLKKPEPASQSSEAKDEASGNPENPTPPLKPSAPTIAPPNSVEAKPVENKEDSKEVSETPKPSIPSTNKPSFTKGEATKPGLELSKPSLAIKKPSEPTSAPAKPTSAKEEPGDKESTSKPVAPVLPGTKKPIGLSLGTKPKATIKKPLGLPAKKAVSTNPEPSEQNSGNVEVSDAVETKKLGLPAKKSIAIPTTKPTPGIPAKKTAVKSVIDKPASETDLTTDEDGSSEAKTQIKTPTISGKGKKVKKAKQAKSDEAKSSKLITGISFLVVDIASAAAAGLFAFWIWEQLSPFWK